MKNKGCWEKGIEVEEKRGRWSVKRLDRVEMNKRWSECVIFE